MVVSLSSPPLRPHIDDVGGKALSLIRLCERGYRVPHGVVLTTAFFAPWFDREPPRPHATGSAVTAPTLTPQQETALQQALRLLGPSESGSYAVRSSSPEEDLEEASFAGEYQSVLGVSPDGIVDALHQCFRGATAERVESYKAAHGLDRRPPRLAVILQHQLDSEVSGVAFSIPPSTNDYDELLIAANWGQGESVVSGAASPDHYVVDKHTGQVKERTLGAKETSLWLDPSVGLEHKRGFRSEAWTLTPSQAAEIASEVARIEQEEGHPVDVEWARAQGQLYLLQARPITRYVPLPACMQTFPGAPRRLYLDAGLMEGATTNAPLSHMTTAYIRDLTAPLGAQLLGSRVLFHADLDQSLLVLEGCRTYANLSNAFWISSPKQLARKYAQMDVVASQILSQLNKGDYRSEHRPKRFRGLRLRILWKFRGFMTSVLRACITPRAFQKDYHNHVTSFEQRFSCTEGTFCLDKDYEDGLAQFTDVFFHYTLPAIFVFWFPGRLFSRVLFWGTPQEIQTQAERLDRGLPDELVVEMGMAIFELSQWVPPEAFASLPALAQRIRAREMPTPFLEAWDSFMQRFGCRGPEEMELSTQRYADDPLILLRQMATMVDAPTHPLEAHEKHLQERGHALETLDRYLRQRWWRRWKRLPLRWASRCITLFGGARDTPKHHLVLLGYQIRCHALEAGRRRVAQGILEQAEQIFEFSVDELRSLETLDEATLHARLRQRAEFRRLLKQKVTNFPHLIDSRGRILQPPAPADWGDGVFQGTPISPGTFRGPVRLLERPDSDSLQAGEVLVAYVTDPGWTPLFLNAGAILLEVGGPLQHGALVAREYGKPCVVGIHQITQAFTNGQWVEVEGSTGIVRLLGDRDPERT